MKKLLTGICVLMLATNIGMAQAADTEDSQDTEVRKIP